MIGAKRWFDGEFFWLSISGDGHSTATRIEHYWREGDGPEPIVYSLEKVSTKGTTSNYKYNVGKDLELLDSFKVFTGEILLFEYIVDDLAKDSLTEKTSPISSPSGPLESRKIEVETFRLWRRDADIFPGLSAISGFVDGVVANGLFPFYEGNYGEVVIDYGFSELHSFRGVLNPTLKSPSEINDLLGDPESLFLGDAFTLYFEGVYGDEENWSLVGIFSDGSTAWKEYYTFDEVFSIGYRLKNRPEENSYASSGVFVKENAGTIKPEYKELLGGHYDSGNNIEDKININDRGLANGGERDFLHSGAYSFSASLEGALPAPESDSFSRSIEDRFAVPSKAYNIFGGL